MTKADTIRATVEVFKTNVHQPSVAQELVASILAACDTCKPTFDLEDCDRVLRVEYRSNTISNEAIRAILHDAGFQCDELND